MTAPAFSTWSIESQGDQQAVVSGYISDDSPEDSTVLLRGAVNGSASVGADGSFQYTSNATLGPVYAQILDGSGEYSDVECQDCTNQVPTLSFSVTPTGNGREVHIEGQVVDDYTAATDVVLTGAADASVTLDSQGDFSLDTEAWSLGTVYATATDVWGQTGSTSVDLEVAAPTISLDVSADSQSTSVSLSGASSAPDLSVTFSGAVNGSLATDDSGNYSGTFNASSLGPVSATVTDAWGQISSTLADLEVAAPTISLDVSADSQSTSVSLSGSSSTPDLSVTFSGAVNGSLATDDSGNYSGTLNAWSLGPFSATVTDAWGQTSSTLADLEVAAPTISLDVSADSQSTSVSLSGSSSTPDLSVTFSGAVNGSLATDDSGNYSGTLNAWSLGPVSATVTDAWGQTSSTSADLEVAAPTISLDVSADSQSTAVSLSGSTSTPGSSVTLSGVVNGSLATDDSGNYSGTLNAWSLGPVSATVTDAWGQTGSTSVDLEVAAPTISLDVSAGAQSTAVAAWGNATAGLSVVLSGVVNGSVGTDDSGNFSGTLDASSLGTVSATVTDAWGQTACITANLSVTAPTISLSASPTGNGREVMITGNVDAPQADGLSVTLSGVVNGSTVVDSVGSFSYCTDATDQGQITASVTDAWNQTANENTSITANEPDISMSASSTGSGQDIVVCGTVNGTSVGGSVITISGEANGSATVNSDGTFSCTIVAEAVGYVTASVANAWGQSTSAMSYISDTPPVITSVSMVYAANRLNFDGELQDGSASSVTVQYNGYATGSIGPMNQGTFYVSLSLPASSSGPQAITFTAIDAWGVSSSPYEVDFDI